MKKFFEDIAGVLLGAYIMLSVIYTSVKIIVYILLAITQTGIKI